jgi:hypothetical protein
MARVVAATAQVRSKMLETISGVGRRIDFFFFQV